MSQNNTKYSAENRKMCFNKVRPGFFVFCFFCTGAGSQLCSAVRFQGEMAGGVAQNIAPISSHFC